MCQIDDDFMAHYQLSYGFNSSDNSAININSTNTNTNTLKTNTNEAQSVENKSESTLDASGVKSEPEKRKLPQPSEPSKLINLFLTLFFFNFYYLLMKYLRWEVSSFLYSCAIYYCIH